MTDTAARSLFDTERFVIDLANEAGRLAMSYYARRDELAIELKTSLADVVTVADRAVEQFIQEAVAAEFPDDSFLGEETGLTAGGAGAPSARRWIVDPIDGTTNFRFGWGSFGISIALADDSGLLAAAVCDPTRSETTSAHAGGGARCNGETVQVRTPAALSEVLIDLAFGKPPERERSLAFYSELADRCCDIRRGATAACGLASVARGGLDAYWARKVQPWDCAAGVLLVREAGGRCEAPDGSEPGVTGCLAAPVKVFDELLEILMRTAT